MDEHLVSLPSATVTWATVGTTPPITQIQLPMKTTLKDILIEISGTYDQSVGVNVQSTEGCNALVQEVRLNLEGKLRRVFKGGALYELNRIVNKGALPQTDADTSVATGKAFNTTLLFDMGLFDTLPEFNKANGDLEHTRAKTFLDLNNWPGQNYLEIVWNPFNFYVSGNTQANMTATVFATPTELLGLRIPMRRQLHAELVLVDTRDMTATKNGDVANLNRLGVYSRGVMLKVGTLAATPNILATTALSAVGLKGNFLNGPQTFFKDKMSPTRLQRLEARDRNGIAPRAGYVWLDHSSDFSYNGGVDGNRLALYQTEQDITGTANTSMQVYQALVRK